VNKTDPALEAASGSLMRWFAVLMGMIELALTADDATNPQMPRMNDRR